MKSLRWTSIPFARRVARLRALPSRSRVPRSSLCAADRLRQWPHCSRRRRGCGAARPSMPSATMTMVPAAGSGCVASAAGASWPSPHSSSMKSNCMAWRQAKGHGRGLGPQKKASPRGVWGPSQKAAVRGWLDGWLAGWLAGDDHSRWRCWLLLWERFFFPRGGQGFDAH